jgi:hypothetical protein
MHLRLSLELTAELLNNLRGADKDVHALASHGAHGYYTRHMHACMAVLVTHAVSSKKAIQCHANHGAHSHCTHATHTYTCMLGCASNSYRAGNDVPVHASQCAHACMAYACMHKVCTLKQCDSHRPKRHILSHGPCYSWWAHAPCAQHPVAESSSSTPGHVTRVRAINLWAQAHKEIFRRARAGGPPRSLRLSRRRRVCTRVPSPWRRAGRRHARGGRSRARASAAAWRGR